MNPVAVFALGMIGALAPEVVRLYSIRHDASRFTWSRFYVVVSLAFGALGGVLALVLPATTYWAALYVGVSTPVLVTTMVKTGRDLARPQLKGPPRPRYSELDSYLHGL